MNLKICANDLKRYKEIAPHLRKYGRSNLVLQLGSDEAVDSQTLKPAGDGEPAPDHRADDLEAMGPTHVNLDILMQKAPRGGKAVPVLTCFVRVALPEMASFAPVMQKLSQKVPKCHCNKGSTVGLGWWLSGRRNGQHGKSGCGEARFLVAFLLVLTFLYFGGMDTAHAAAAASSASRKYELSLPRERLEFDPASDLDLTRLERAVEAALQQPTAAPEDSKLQRHLLQKRDRRGLEELQRLIRAVRASSSATQRSECVALLLETVVALNNDQRPLLPATIDVLETPWVFLSHMHRPVGRGHTPATNLAPGPQLDLSRLDPLPSTWWHRPVAIPAADLYHGFGRTNWLHLEDKLCEYSAPKRSSGLNPGFEVHGEGLSIKLKFAEVSSEPFVTRMFDVLGFQTDPTDYVPAVRVRYDRRIFQEFHSRRPLHTRFTFLFFIPYYTLELQKHYDPFAYIAWAVRRDGTRWSGQELKARLFHDPKRPHPEEEAANFRPEVETDIDYLITVPANVQARVPNIKSIGLWDFGQLDHAGRRELRGAGLLAAWLGWFDTRLDNTHLCTIKHQGGIELGHYISDLGGGLGETSGLLNWRGESPNAFPWTFTRPPLWQGPHRLARPLRLEGYKPIVPTKAFAEMTIDDARWMARLIGQLTERQLVQALVASGYDSTEVRIYTEKLVSRRDRMVLDLGLAHEIPPLRPKGVDRTFSYEPLVDGPVTIVVSGGLGTAAQSPAGEKRIVRGKLVMLQGISANAVFPHYGLNATR